MAHFDEVFDVGFDYGASGGQSWDTQIIAFPSGVTKRNQRRSAAVGQWQLGNREILDSQWAYIQGFMHAMRGRLNSFLFKDWTDYSATEQQLVLDGSNTTQLIKTYGLSINPWIRDITKPNASTVVIEELVGSTWVALEAGVDYTLDDSTGVITWDSPPDSGTAIRWSGEFYVPVRFDRDVVVAQFIGAEPRNGRLVHAYAIGDLAVIEEPNPETPA